MPRNAHQPSDAAAIQSRPEPEPPVAEHPGFPVVGIVASAGGLDAFKKFFQAMPPNGGAAFVLVPHLDPRHESLIAQLLAHHTKMPVHEAEEGTRVEPNCVYVIPPDKFMEIHAGALRLRGPVAAAGAQTAIDIFLHSLADDLQDRAICIVLSGTGSHGALGLKAIKANGGMAMVQEPRSAEYDGMPRNAVATGLADFVLPPQGMPGALLNYIAHVFGPGRDDAQPVLAARQTSQLLALLRAHSKFDFRPYRKGMLMRRVSRRIGLSHAGGLGEYLALLRERPEELKQLTKDLLISVTSFFRDPEMFRFLEEQVIPELLRTKTDDAPLRIWVPGCATGEEAYSIAMLFIEQIAAAQKPFRVQVFATDIDQDALDVARRGVYGDSEIAQVSPARVARFFARKDEHVLQVTKQLRESVLFAPQNVLADAPFSRIDLVSCRNLLIYLESEVQQKVAQLLHFALVDGGYLVLGPSESVGRHVELFEPVSRKWRIYRRVASARPRRIEFPITLGGEDRGLDRAQAPAISPASLIELGAQALLEYYAPASVLVNHRLEVLNFYGPTARYLQQPSGIPTQDLVALTHAGLRARVRAAAQKCLREGVPVRAAGAKVKRNGGYATVHVSAQPLRGPRGPRGAEALALVTFEEERAARGGRRAEAAQIAQVSLAHQLEHELKSTRAELQSTIEELKASNEEVMSMNEELQSANEELETSKEELQSLNEELSTVNSQLLEKVEQLEVTNNDVANLLKSADIATVFLASDRTIKRYTPAASALFRLIATDVGRPIGDVVARFADPELSADIDAVLHELTPLEKEVLTEEGRWYLRRITPYRTLDDRIDGAVLLFGDVTPLKHTQQLLRTLATELEKRVAQRTAQLEGEVRERARAEQSLRAERNFVHAILSTASALIAVLDTEGRFVRFNKACEEVSGLGAGEIEGKKTWDALVPDEEHDAVRQVFEGLRAGRFPSRHENHWQHRDGSRRLIAWSNTCLLDADGAVQYMVATGIDVTDQRRTEQEVVRRQAEVAQLHRLHAMGELAALVAHELNQPLAAIASYGEASLGQLQRGEDGQKLQRNLQQIVQQAQRAGQSLHELRQFLAKEQPKLAPTDLNTLLRAACSLVDGIARAHGVRLDCAFDASLPNIIAHGIQIEHVLVNLLQNALDAIRDAGMTEGSVTVRVRREGRGSVEVSVEDSGPGIDAALAEKVFEPLYTTKAEGLGLGLSICRSMIEAQGGRIWAEPGPGGKFRFTLPVGS
ncbi:MAG TPA: chemotaxis protein CheB [Burkholderiales bacterium]|nr:chemotaxis protein CheB [Burkholderiales bacterium]